MISLFIRNKTFWSWIFILWSFVIVILNIVPNYTPPALKTNEDSVIPTDYILHFLTFFLLPVFYFLSGKRMYLFKFHTNIWLIFVAGLIFAVLVEAIQMFVTGRTFNPVDIIFNICGLLCGIPAGKLINIIAIRSDKNNNL